MKLAPIDNTILVEVTILYELGCIRIPELQRVVDVPRAADDEALVGMPTDGVDAEGVFLELLADGE